jgi:hypothetical protein
VLKRIVKKQLQILEGIDGVNSLIESKIGEPTSKDGPSSKLRQFYTRSYPALDRFDRLWYEMRFFSHARDWESYFCWALLHTAVVNARTAYCMMTSKRLSMIEFLRVLVDSYLETLL